MPARRILSLLSLLSLLLLIAGALARPGAADAQSPTTRPVDVLDYLLQRDDANERWTLGGTDVRPDRDPDGTDARTFILNKWSDPNCYEVLKATATQVQIRYEVSRPSESGASQYWIRRFEEIGGDGAAPGAVWMSRFMVPGGPGYLSRYRQDRFVFDRAAGRYVVDKSGSAAEAETYITVQRVTERWGEHNQTGFDLSDVLRMTSQWQRDGLMLEMYDYARGKGLVAWRWLERVSTLRPAAGDRTGKVFHCEGGFVRVDSRGDASTPPVVRQYDPATRRAGRRLEVIRLTSYWKPELGPQWYVVYRDTTREQPLKRNDERVAHDFSLPEWRTHPGATLVDLPYLYTHPPTK
jgi:hypothetical protein